MNVLLIAVSVTLAWDPNPPGDNIVLYNMHIATQSMLAGNPPLVDYPVYAPDTQFVAELSFGQLYFFTVTAVNDLGIESGYSNEVQYTPMPEPTPTPPEPTPTPSATPTPTPTPEPTTTPTPTPEELGPPWHWGWWK